ncbi:hypothetical protein DY000_02027990 [Brassica cretica]|uniref:Uncharacterized protein n=1 Tax=Brassica cretica TaxID=69181 RepID=A0ABQ7EIP0_BRACR|nr:hypothetical protein DY000_02027990 [Brassica cretica]
MKAFTPRSQNPATAELKKPPPPEDKGRGDGAPIATIDVGSLPELTTTVGNWTRAQTKRSGRGGERETVKMHLNGRTEGSGDGTLAHAPAVRRTQRNINNSQ